MRYFPILLFLLLLSLNAKSQHFINGFVLDSIGEPLMFSAFITVTPSSGKDSTYIEPGRSINVQEFHTNAKGSFHILTDSIQSLNLTIRSYGYQTKEITLEKWPTEILYIYLERDTVDLYQIDYPKGGKWRRFPTEVGLNLDFLDKDFSNFTELLGEDNVNGLGNVPLLLTVEVGKEFNRLYTSLEFGLGFSNKEIDDSLNIEVNGNMFAFNLGYKVVDSKRWMLMPKIAVKRYRLRLIRSQEETNIPLATYVEDTDLDLRFIQPTMDLGLTLGYKHSRKGWVEGSYMIFGIHGGYPISLRKTPNVNGLRTTLETDQSITLGDFGLTLFWRAHFGVNE